MKFVDEFRDPAAARTLLTAIEHLADIHDVELRLRRRFESAHLHASLTALHA